MKPKLWCRVPGGVSRRNGDRNAVNRGTLFPLNSSFPNADRLRVGKRTSKAATSTKPEKCPKFAVKAAAKQNAVIKAAGMSKVLNCNAQNTNQNLCIYVYLRDGTAQMRVSIRSKKGAMCARGELTMAPNAGMCPGWEGRLKENVQELINAHSVAQAA